MSDDGLKSVCLDLILSVDAQLFFHLKLNGKTVGIPARLTKNPLALHSLITGDHILDYSGKHVADVGLAVCGRRTVEEGEVFLSLSKLNALAKNVLFLPEGAYCLFTLDEVEVRRNLFIHFSSFHFFSLKSQATGDNLTRLRMFYDYFIINPKNKKARPIRKRTNKPPFHIRTICAGANVAGRTSELNRRSRAFCSATRR